MTINRVVVFARVMGVFLILIFSEVIAQALFPFPPSHPLPDTGEEIIGQFNRHRWAQIGVAFALAGLMGLVEWFYYKSHHDSGDFSN